MAWKKSTLTHSQTFRFFGSRAKNCPRQICIYGLEKVSIEAFADFFLRLFRIYGYALRLASKKAARKRRFFDLF
jgi:hypothetical protein